LQWWWLWRERRGVWGSGRVLAHVKNVYRAPSERRHLGERQTAPNFKDPPSPSPQPHRALTSASARPDLLAMTTRHASTPPSRNGNGPLTSPDFGSARAVGPGRTDLGSSCRPSGGEDHRTVGADACPPTVHSPLRGTQCKGPAFKTPKDAAAYVRSRSVLYQTPRAPGQFARLAVMYLEPVLTIMLTYSSSSRGHVLYSSADSEQPQPFHELRAQQIYHGKPHMHIACARPTLYSCKELCSAGNVCVF
jgi:hypothetical protein